jgi:hypothetical protein
MAKYLAQKTLPIKPSITYCNSGRTAFYFAIVDIKPRRMHLPNFICPILIDVVQRHFPEISIVFYDVKGDLTFDSFDVGKDEVVVVIEYFGLPTKNLHIWPSDNLLLDLTHIPNYQWRNYARYKYFGSLRKLNKIADGGFHSGFQIHKYGAVENVESQLNLRAKSWNELRNAEESLDASFRRCDMSSASLSIFLESDHQELSRLRLRNWQTIQNYLGDSVASFDFDENAIPYIGHLEFASKSDRDFASAELANIGVFGAIHWDTPKLVTELRVAGEANQRFGDRMLSIPLGFDLDEYPLQEILEILSKVKNI